MANIVRDTIEQYLDALNLNINALDMLVEEYEDCQEFEFQNGEYKMITGNTIDEINDWIKHRNTIDIEYSDNPRVQALADFLYDKEGIYVPANEIEVEYNRYNYLGDEYKTPYGTFNVLLDREADQATIEYQENLWDDLGLNSFTEYAKEYIINNCIDCGDLEDFMEDDYQSYYEDIESEPDRIVGFDNRLQQELAEKDGFGASDLDEINDLQEEIEAIHEDIDELEDEIDDLQYAINGITDELEELRDEYDEIENNENYNKKEELEREIEHKEDELNDFENEFSVKESELKYLKNNLYEHEKELDNDELYNWLNNYEDNKDDLIEKAVQSIIDEYDNPIEWFIDNFGINSFNELVESGELNITPDFEKIAEFCNEEDGRGHSLSSWDGVEYEQGEFYIYQQSDQDERSNDFINDIENLDNKDDYDEIEEDMF